MKKDFKLKWILGGLVLMLVVVFVSSFALAETPSKNSELYPTTPEGVVKAFLNHRGNFSFVYSYPKSCENLLRYVIDGETYRDKYCGGGKKLISDFKIIETKINKDTAEVSVKHFFCGWCANDGSCSVEKSEAIGSYKLSIDKNKWKIKEWYSDGCPFPCDGWMTVDEAIKMNNYSIDKGAKHLGTKEKLKQLIKNLKQCKDS